MLALDPIGDREEYAELVDLVQAQAAGTSRITAPEQLLTADSRAARRLGQRAANLGVLDWELWDPEAPSLLAALRAGEHRCTVVDLGSLATPGA